MAVEFIDYNFTVEVNEDTNVVEIRYEGLNADNLALLTTRVDVLEDAFALQSGTTTGTISGIQSDIAALEAADIVLQNNITAEAGARIAADAALANSIALVAPPLQANIDAEAAARIAADAAEVVARNAAIAAATAPIIADAVALEGTVNSHTATISAIAADQVTVNANVAALDASFDALSADFAAWSADFTDVQDAVTAETAARIAADAAITAMITVPVSWKAPVRAATTVAGTLATSFEVGDVIDGVTLALGDRILIKNQAAGAENGIYTVNATGAPTRATDMDSSSEVSGAAMLITEGTSNGDTLYFCSTNAPITLGTTALVFTQISGAGVSDGDKGDITVSAGGTTWTIDAGAVTLAKMANMNTAKLLGRSTAGAGSPEEISIGSGLSLSGGTLAATGGGGGGGAVFSGASLKFNANKAVTANVAWAWDSAEWDTSGFWSAGTPSRLTIPAGMDGKYLVTVSTDGSPSGADYDTTLQLNGVLTRHVYSEGAYQRHSLATVLDLAAGDYLEVLNTVTNHTQLAATARFQLYRLGWGGGSGGGSGSGSGSAIFYENDFLPGEFGWSTTAGAYPRADAHAFSGNGGFLNHISVVDAAHPGVISFGPGVSNNGGVISLGLTNDIFIAGSNQSQANLKLDADDLVLDYIIRANSVTAANGYWRVGLVADVDDYANTIFFGLNSAGTGTVRLECAKASAYGTATASPAPAANTWFHLQIRANTTSVRAYIDGVLAATVSDTTKIPTVGMFPVFQSGNISGLPGLQTDVDYFRISKAFSTSRAPTLTGAFGEASVPLSPDTRPASPNAIDDEFEGTSLDGKWAWRNQSSATATLSSGSLILYSPSGTSGGRRCLEQTVSGTFKVRAKVALHAFANFGAGGLMLARNANGKLLLLGKVYDSGNGNESMSVNRMDSPTAFNAAFAAGDYADRYGAHQQFAYMEAEYDGTNVIFRVSGDGVVYDSFYTETAAAFLGGAPDRVGLFVDANNASNEARIVCDWFRRIA